MKALLKSSPMISWVLVCSCCTSPEMSAWWRLPGACCSEKVWRPRRRAARRSRGRTLHADPLACHSPSP